MWLSGENRSLWFDVRCEETRGTDPVDFQLEGSMDGTDWYMLNTKARP